MPERKQVNFTIVPDEPSDVVRTYSNFCAISHTPFDFTLTFCEVLPPSETEVRAADSADRQPDAARQLRAPVRARIVVPTQFVPSLITALQEHARAFSEAPPKVSSPKDAVH
jgi:hypothetical protein